MASELELDTEISEKLDTVIELLEDLFILQATTAGMNKHKLRKILGLSMMRVSRISKNLAKEAK